MKSSERNKFLVFSLLILVLFIDQISKSIFGKFIPVACNKGIAFGFGQSGLLFSLMALAVVLWLISREKNSWRKLLLAIIFGAGFSNLMDRVFYGCVRDFINVDIIPTFNVADMMISVSVILLFVNIIRQKTDET